MHSSAINQFSLTLYKIRLGTHFSVLWSTYRLRKSPSSGQYQFCLRPEWLLSPSRARGVFGTKFPPPFQTSLCRWPRRQRCKRQCHLRSHLPVVKVPILIVNDIHIHLQINCYWYNIYQGGWMVKRLITTDLPFKII